MELDPRHLLVDSFKVAVGAADPLQIVPKHLPPPPRGRTLVVGVPWAELIIMSQGALPPNNEWRHDGANGCFVPTKGCPRDADDIRLGITPDECTRNLKAGIAANKITTAAIQQFLGSGRR